MGVMRIKNAQQPTPLLLISTSAVDSGAQDIF